jgi:hypothetical protein
MRAVAPSPGSPKPAGSAGQPAADLAGPGSAVGRTAVNAVAPVVPVAPAAPVAAEPSWPQVVATTIKLWALRRLRATRRWQLGAFVAALALVAVAVLAFTGVFAGSAAPGHPPASSTASAHARGGSARPAVTVSQAAAAAWIAGQVSDDAIVACDPAMCAALQAQGITAGRLLPLPTGQADPVAASVVVTSTSAGSQLADRYAPAVIASFGSGSSRIDVRAIVPGGRAGYESALRADLAARQSAGTQLLRNRRIQFTARDAAQLRAGAVDSRVLATLAALSSQYALRVAAFGDAAPGAAVLLRAVTVTIGGSGNRAAELAAALALVHAQRPPYLPAYAAIIHPAGGRAALSIQFAAPSPLGLLTAVLDADTLAAAPTLMAGEVFSGRH